jgi:hypothetical protein
MMDACAVLCSMICVATLVCHESTITALSFSPDSRCTHPLTYQPINQSINQSINHLHHVCVRYIASGGKDRSLWIHEVSGLGAGASYVPIACVKSAHKRIIWDLT